MTRSREWERRFEVGWPRLKAPPAIAPKRARRHSSGEPEMPPSGYALVVDTYGDYEMDIYGHHDLVPAP